MTRTLTRINSGAADHAEGAVFQHAQQVALPFGRKVADFVQEQSAAIGQLEAAGLVGHRAREGALGMAEKLGFQQVFGQGRAVDGDKGAVVSFALRWMARATNSLPVPLSPSIKDGHVALRDFLDQAQDGAHALAFATAGRARNALQAGPQFVVFGHDGLEFQRLLTSARRRCMSSGLDK